MQLDIMFDKLPLIARELRPEASRIVRSTCLAIEADTKLNIVANGRVDTGSYLNSVYTVTGNARTSSYGDASSDVASRNPDAVMLPELQNDGATSGIVVVGVEHGIYNEFGTDRMEAAPALIPAAEKNRQPFLQRMQGLIRG